MTPNAIGQHNTLLPLGNTNEFRCPTRMKDHDIFETVNGFPDVISGQVFMGKVAIDALD